MKTVRDSFVSHDCHRVESFFLAVCVIALRFVFPCFELAGEVQNGHVITLPTVAPGATEGLVIRSNRDGVVANITGDQSTYTIDTDKLKTVGRHVITVETPNGTVLEQYTVTKTRKFKKLFFRFVRKVEFSTFMRV